MKLQSNVNLRKTAIYSNNLSNAKSHNFPSKLKLLCRRVPASCILQSTTTAKNKSSLSKNKSKCKLALKYTATIKVVHQERSAIYFKLLLLENLNNNHIQRSLLCSWEIGKAEWFKVFNNFSLLEVFLFSPIELLVQYRIAFEIDITGQRSQSCGTKWKKIFLMVHKVVCIWATYWKTQ